MLNIVLFEPEIPQNTGNISRTCAVVGARLHIVGPIGFDISDKAAKRAGLDYWEYVDINYYENIEEYYRRHAGENDWYFTTKAPHHFGQVTYGKEPYLIFGKESAGIPEEVLVQHRERCVRIPMLPDRRSLNLSNSVCVGAYEVLRQNHYAQLEEGGHLHRLSWNG